MNSYLNQLPLSLKLTLPAIVLSIIVVFIGAISYQRLGVVVHDYEIIAKDILPTTRGAEEMYTDFQAVRIGLRTLGLPNVSKEEQEIAVKSVLSAVESYEKMSQQLQTDPGVTPEELIIWKEVNRDWLVFKDVGNRVLELQKTRQNEESVTKMLAIFYKDCPEAAENYKRSISKLITFLDNRASFFSTNADQLASKAKIIIIWSIVAGILFGILLTIFAVKSSSDLVKSINKITEILSHKSTSLNSIAENVSESSSTVLHSSSEQAAAIQETTAAIEETSAMIAKTAENAKTSTDLSYKSKELCSDGLKSMNHVLQSMEDINQINIDIENSIQQSNKELESILNIITEIGTKANVINEIVFQTKLLSFNASVEAARAGEQGKGFAVVAEEVGNLAQMSGKSANEIRALLEESTLKVSAVVHNTKQRMDSIVKEAKEKVHQGKYNTNECSEILEKIDNSVSEVSHLIDEIAQASDEQSKGVIEINQAISNLDVSAQRNQSTAQDSYKLAEELKAESEEVSATIIHLKQIVGNSKKPEATVHHLRATNEEIKKYAS